MDEREWFRTGIETWLVSWKRRSSKEKNKIGSDFLVLA